MPVGNALDSLALNNGNIFIDADGRLRVFYNADGHSISEDTDGIKVILADGSVAVDKVVFNNQAADPDAAGELQRNGADFKVHDGVAVRSVILDNDFDTHASRHEQGGVDEIQAENLMTLGTAGDVLRANIGGICAVDDDYNAGKLNMVDQAADPASGKLQRNGTDLKFHDGVAVKTLLHNGDATKYVVRDVATADKTTVDFTTDGNWHVNGLDLSAIVPAGAIAVDLLLEVMDDNLSTFYLRRDAVNAYNKIVKSVQVVGRTVYEVARIAINSDRLLDYRASNTTWTIINVTVMGYVMGT